MSVPFITGVLSVALASCSGATVPNTELGNAKASYSAAQTAGAGDVPEAALHLKLSNDAIGAAEGLIDKGDQSRAKMLLERARTDADLAFLIAREAQARNDLHAFTNRMDRK